MDGGVVDCSVAVAGGGGDGVAVAKIDEASPTKGRDVGIKER